MTDPSEPSIIVDISRREFLAGMAAVTLLAACGGGDGSGGQAGGTSAPARRTITHSVGSTEVSVRAQRVVTLSEALDGHLSSVGLVGVGAVEDVGDWLAPYRPRLDAKLNVSVIPAVGSATEPNYEPIAGLRPELIIAEDFSKDLYPKLSAIAPTVLISRPNNAAWKSAFDQTVSAVGRDEEAESVRQRYLKTLGEVSGRAGGLEISFVRINDDGTFIVDGTKRFGGSVGAEAGFAVTDAPADVADSFKISGERLDLVTGGLIVLPDRRADVDTVAAFSKNPLWSSLPAVKAGRVVAVPNPVYNGGTYVAAELLLGAISRAVR